MQELAEVSCLDLVVLDDVVRFAWHACHLLAGEPGLGIGDIGADKGEMFWRGETPVPFASSSGQLRVWWVPLRRGWDRKLDLVLESIRTSGKALFLVDLRPHSEAAAYSPDAVIGRIRQEQGRAKWFKQGDIRQHVQLVSSYGANVGQLSVPGHATDLLFRVRSKSPLLFYRIARKHFPVVQAPESDGTRHVLITGAGFDLRSTRPEEICTFGLPATNELIKETQVYLQQRFKDKNEALDHLITKLKSIQLERDGLDLSMTRVLEALRRDAAESPPPGLTSAQWMNRAENHLRNAFRSVVARYDFGVTSQSVNAAQTPFMAWLTTNYTRFPERAIALHEEAMHHKKPKRVEWSLVTTALEADKLSLSHVPANPEVLDATIGVPHACLFKLHGDVGLIDTMSIAGSDKVDGTGFFRMYRAAQDFLGERVRKSKVNLVWHVVGHGMQDWLLLETICRVHAMVPRGSSVTFKVANGTREWSNQAALRIEKALGKRGSNAALEPMDCGAAKYLWRLQPIPGATRD